MGLNRITETGYNYKIPTHRAQIKVTADLLHAEQNIMEDLLLKHLIDSQVDESDLKEQVIPRLLHKGVKKVADLEFLEKEDLEGDYNLTII